MPEISGLEMCEMMKKNPFYSQIPLLLMTGFATVDSKAKSYIAGADDYIEKPFEIDAMYKAVTELISS